MDINNQRLIYFYSPMGTWIRINKNLDYLGLNKNKKVGNTYTRDFNDSVKENGYKEKYKELDVLILDEFYDHEINYELCWPVIKELMNSGKHIVMAGHGNIESLAKMPEEMKSKVSLYNLKYDLDWDFSYDREYIK